ncbi:hypothetical protein [Neobacillus drentensis]|uniref:hypothetical protein n=1 Tax=Neobacillus drentensis TaxID=220684 RepID=UPI002FFF862A
MVETDVNEYLYPFIWCYYQKALNRKSNLSIRKLRKKEKGKKLIKYNQLRLG